MSDPTIYFIRHGETEWNRLGRLQGQMDIPINPAGRGQAKRNGGVLAEVLDAADGIDFVASPLTRTRQTNAATAPMTVWSRSASASGRG